MHRLTSNYCSPRNKFLLEGNVYETSNSNLSVEDNIVSVIMVNEEATTPDSGLHLDPPGTGIKVMRKRNQYVLINCVCTMFPKTAYMRVFATKIPRK